MSSLYSVSEIDGNLFRKMLLNGLANLSVNEQKVNDMNVFPVPDGDTGTNMRLTLLSGIESTEPNANVGKFLADCSKGMLLGARGNSGVIVSQIFKGISSAVVSLEKLNVSDFVKALICGYKTAYAALTNPVEGTVLTVAREGTECFANRFESGFRKIDSFGKMFDIYLEGMYKSLERTPKLLKRLQEANVTDSGAYGFILIMEGMAKYLSGVEIQYKVDVVHSGALVDFSAFNSNSNFEYGYCMEFLLRLMSAKCNVDSFDYDKFVSDLNVLGESVVCVRDVSIVKVHIHVFKPAPVIELVQQFGEFLTFKLENMCLQHSEKIVENKLDCGVESKHYPLAVITPVNGSGWVDTIGSFPFVYTINSVDGLNTSAQEFVKACKSVDADKIVIMPNNKNVLASAKQAVSILANDYSSNISVEIVPTQNMVECYFALAMDDDTADIDTRVSAFKDNAQSVNSITVARATKTVKLDGVDCVKGWYVSYLNGKPVCCSSAVSDVVVSALKRAEAFSVCSVFTGKDFTESNTVENVVRAVFPDVDLSVLSGNQDIYELLIGLL